MFSSEKMCVIKFIHSFIPDNYIAPLQETYSEALSVQLRSKINVIIKKLAESVSRHSAASFCRSTDIRLGGGHFNTCMFPSISSIFLRWRDANAYRQTRWGFMA